MKQVLKSGAILLALSILLPGCALMGAGEPSKPLHFYTIGPVPEQTDTSGSDSSERDSNRPSLVVSPFNGSGIYTEAPIVWKNQQHLQRFKYNRWANPPARMLQDVVVQLLRRETPGDGTWVHSATSDIENSPYQIRGNLRNLYLKRNNETWEVVLNLDLMLIRQDSSQSLGPSISSEDIAGSWSLHATGQADAPETEQQTPSAMNTLLADLNRNLSGRGGKIARSILERLEAVSRTGESEKND